MQALLWSLAALGYSDIFIKLGKRTGAHHKGIRLGDQQAAFTRFFDLGSVSYHSPFRHFPLKDIKKTRS
jgi:hypothetical protein